MVKLTYLYEAEWQSHLITDLNYSELKKEKQKKTTRVKPTWRWCWCKWCTLSHQSMDSGRWSCWFWSASTLCSSFGNDTLLTEPDPSTSPPAEGRKLLLNIVLSINGFNCSKWRVFTKPRTKSGLFFKFQFWQQVLSGLREILNYKLTLILKLISVYMSLTAVVYVVLYLWSSWSLSWVREIEALNCISCHVI